MQLEQFWWRNNKIVGGFDIGKKRNPSHLSLFAITNNDMELVQVCQRFLDGWEYVKQVDFLTAYVEYFGVDRLYYDNTRGELEERNMPKQCEAIVLGKTTGRKSKGEMELAVNFSKMIEQSRIKLIDDDRYISQITCLTPGNRIYIKYKENIKRKGYKNIEDIQIGDYVKTHKNRFRKVIKTMRRYVNEEILELALDNGKYISLTKNHPILTKFGWKEAGELTTNDVLMKVIHSHTKINRPKKRQTYEEYYGLEKAKELKKKLSLSHIGKHVLEKIMIKCIFCNKKLSLQPCRAKTRKFCSRKCAGDFYSEEVKNRKGFGASGLKGKDSPAWREHKSSLVYSSDFNYLLKFKILKRDNFNCQLCGNHGGRLMIHHIDYDKFNSNEQNLITLCHSCHSKTTFGKKEYWIDFFSTVMLEKLKIISNGTHIKKISTKYYKGYVYNLEVDEDHSYCGSGIIFHNCMSNSLKAPSTSSGHADSFWSTALAISVYHDYYAPDRKRGTSLLGSLNETLSPTEKSPMLDENRCKSCNKRALEVLEDGRKKCNFCFTVYPKENK